MTLMVVFIYHRKALMVVLLKYEPQYDPDGRLIRISTHRMAIMVVLLKYLPQYGPDGI